MKCVMRHCICYSRLNEKRETKQWKRFCSHTFTRIIKLFWSQESLYWWTALSPWSKKSPGLNSRICMLPLCLRVFFLVTPDPSHSTKTMFLYCFVQCFCMFRCLSVFIEDIESMENSTKQIKSFIHLFLSFYLALTDTFELTWRLWCPSEIMYDFGTKLSPLMHKPGVRKGNRFIWCATGRQSLEGDEMKLQVRQNLRGCSPS